MRTNIEKSMILQLATHKDITISNEDLETLSIQINTASEDLLKLDDMISIQTSPSYSFNVSGSY
ncbi:MAG: hypothetical protein VX869_07505 [Chloroflexota bacterium]|nr:hypothetical protein [Chloroflexota bacterium]